MEVIYLKAAFIKRVTMTYILKQRKLKTNVPYNSFS